MKNRRNSFIISVFVVAFLALPFSAKAGIFSADKPDLKCELASVKKVLQTAEKISNKSPDYKYYKWECVNLGRKYDWYERGNQEKTPFAGVDFDSSVPAGAKGGGNSSGNVCDAKSCKDKCDDTTETTDKSKTCSNPGKSCCVPKNSGGACDAKSCKDKCDDTTETTDKSKTCSNPGKSCCVPKSSTNPSNGGGSGTGGGTQSLTFDNPLSFNTVEEVLTVIMTTLQKLVVTLALLFLVLGAIMYIISAGDDKRMGSAKGIMTASMIGMAIALAAPSFLKEISGILKWDKETPNAVVNALSLSEIAMRVLNFLLSVVGILTMIMLIIGAIMYLTALGDEKKVEDGKKIVKFSLIGITIAFASLIIVQQIAKFFS